MLASKANRDRLSWTRGKVIDSMRRRKRLQKGTVRIQVSGGVKKWVGRFRDFDGTQCSRVLGLVCKMSRGKAERALAEMLEPINNRVFENKVSHQSLGSFVKNSYLPHKLGRWKGSTSRTNTDRLKAYVLKDLGDRSLHSFTRNELQAYLNSKADAGLSYFSISHIRSDLKLIFTLAVEDGILEVNPGGSLYVAREAPQPKREVMTFEQLRQVLMELPLRDRLIAKLSSLAGMRPGEILALQWGDLKVDSLRIERRTYRGVIDTPKSHRSVRTIAVPQSILEDLAEWRKVCPDGGSASWMFPSENPENPLQVSNFLARGIKPVLVRLGLGWVNFLVLRRSCASLLNQTGADPKVVADQLGHDIGVSIDVYTKTSASQRGTAVNRLDNAVLGKMLDA